MTTYALPPDAEVSIGQSSECHVRVEDPGIAPIHARLRTRPTLSVTDAAGGGSTVVRGRKLAPGETAELAPGVVMLLGSVVMVLQASPTTSRLRHVRSHDFFAGQLDDECLRAGSRGGCFGVVRVRFGTSQAKVLEEAFTRHLRETDVVAMYAADEYELLLVERSPDAVAEICQRLQKHVAQSRGGDLRIGFACWIQHGRSPEALLAEAGLSLRGVEAELASAGPTVGWIDGLRPLLERIAPTSINVLIMGETGAGKEVLARRIHEMSDRANLPMVVINCAALPDALLESELFGYERGAFTGAVQAKEGLVEAARGSTVLLDEVGELSLSLQAKLLRAVEQRKTTRLGGLKVRDVNVRYLAATSRDLEAEVASGRFRQDLFYRLNGAMLVVPPLRERLAEIDALSRVFIGEFAAQNGRSRVPQLSRPALRLLERYAWPGNVRELKNLIERAVALCQDDVIDLAHFPLERLGLALALERTSGPLPRIRPLVTEDSLCTPGTYAHRPSDEGWEAACDIVHRLERTAAAAERSGVQRALEQCGGNQTHAARLLGISRRALITRVERYGLTRPRKR